MQKSPRGKNNYCIKKPESFLMSIFPMSLSLEATAVLTYITVA